MDTSLRPNGSWPWRWQLDTTLNKIAIVLPPSSLPVNSQFFRPVAIVFMCCSDTLLSIARYPELA